MSIKRDLIYIDNQNVTDRVEKFFVEDGRCVVVFKNSDKQFYYSKNRAKIVHTAISSDKAYSVFNYLKDIAHSVGLTTERGENSLAKSYDTISEISKHCILSGFLNETEPSKTGTPFKTIIFPFGFNHSQKNAVQAAFDNNISVIEGPPGTGKTQTIINIIANAIVNNKSVAVVSANNSATRNVYEKLEKNGIAYIAAFLGNSQNKKEFIDSQKEIPDLSHFHLSFHHIETLKEKTKRLFHDLSSKLDDINELAALKQQTDELKTEYKHFKNTFDDLPDVNNRFKRNITANKLLEFWIFLESVANKEKKISFIRKLICRLKYGIKEKTFNAFSVERMIAVCQWNYYEVKINELERRIQYLEQSLMNYEFDKKMKEYTGMAMTLLKGELHKRYNQQKRRQYTISNLRNKSEEFIKDYPVIMSTTYSLRQSLSDEILYDYVIIDEASQVDLATGALSLSCAKNAVIVGDTRQLPNVVDAEMRYKTDIIFESYRLKKPYRYSDHSLLTAVIEIFPRIHKELLKEHYRCHPKIIEFCNKKFYDNQLIVLTGHTAKRESLVVYKTARGNHARNRLNQRQIDMIKEEIIPNERLEGIDLGIVTPYRNQTNALQETFQHTSIKADTVDKFQGRENTVIILSTVDNEISEFSDNPNRLNVAVSRAIEQLILVVNDMENQTDSNIADLMQYIEYNNFSVKASNLNSIFDLLYKGYEKERTKILSKSKRVSAFDSENLMYVLIKEVLKKEAFMKYDVLTHFPLGRLIRDTSLLNIRETTYATHPLTHIDFLIYNKLGKTPVLAIEVDGYQFHKTGTQQAERDRLKNGILEKYNIPLLRFGTTESNEKIKLSQKLHELQQSNRLS